MKSTVWRAALYGTALALVALVSAFVFVATGMADGPTYRSPRIASPEQPVSTAREWSWTGIYAGVGVGGMAAIHDLNATTTFSEKPDSAFVNGIGSWDYLADAKLGADWQLPNSALVVGVFAGYGIGSTEASVGVNGTTLASLELTPTWNVGVRAGIVAPYNALIYIGYKYQVADLDLRGEVTPVSREVHGHGLIAGYELPMTKAFTLALEYGYTQFDTGELSSNPAISVSGDTDVHTIMLRGNVRLGPNLF